MSRTCHYTCIVVHYHIIGAIMTSALREYGLMRWFTSIERYPMSFRSTAKQRLWLSCLGYNVLATADSLKVQSLFDQARECGIYKQPPNSSQVQLAMHLGVNIEGDATAYDVAGKLYNVPLLRAWVYSVWRTKVGIGSFRY